MAAFSDVFLSEKEFEDVLASPCCYDHGVKVSEAAEKIAADQKYYHTCSLCVRVCCTTKNIINTSKKDWLLEHLRRS